MPKTPDSPMKRRAKPTLKQIQQIRWALCMTDSMRFLRCQAKSRTKAIALERAGDPSHLAPGHVCRLCRCDRVAGEGTYGDFYGIGENTGHYGVGWCRWHGESPRKVRNAEKFARHQMEAMQQLGKAQSSKLGDFIDVVHDDAEVYSMVKQVRQASGLVLKHLEEFKKLCDDGELTQSFKGNNVPASDETRIRLACEVARTIAQITKTEVDVAEKRMIPVEEIVMRVKMEMDLVRRFITDPREQVKFFDEFKEIWKSVVQKGGA